MNQKIARVQQGLVCGSWLSKDLTKAGQLMAKGGSKGGVCSIKQYLAARKPENQENRTKKTELYHVLPGFEVQLLDQNGQKTV